jgi:hypothetical protein
VGACPRTGPLPGNAGVSGLCLWLEPKRKPRRRVRLPLAAMSEGAGCE